MAKTRADVSKRLPQYVGLEGHNGVHQGCILWMYICVTSQALQQQEDIQQRPAAING
jgi:hypothetical protein